MKPKAFFSISVFLVLIAAAATAQDSVYAVDFKPTDCKGSLDIDRKKDHIVSRVWRGDTLEMEVFIKEECCLGFLGAARKVNDTIQLLYADTGSACECMCCYHLTYYLLGVSKKDSVFVLNVRTEALDEHPYPLVPVEYFIHKGDTTGYQDHYGFAHGEKHRHWYGLWVTYQYENGEVVLITLRDADGNLLTTGKRGHEIDLYVRKHHIGPRDSTRADYPLRNKR